MTREQTPLDEISGLPLLIVPHDTIPDIMAGSSPRHNEFGQPIADLNHVWHPAKEVVNAGKGGVALRNSRTQFVMRDEHNEYHGYYSGPELPAKPADRFRASVLCAAGYIPMQALKFTSDGPEIVTLTEDQRDRLRQSGEVSVASSFLVDKFLREFVIAQPIAAKPKTIDKFLRLNPSESRDAHREHRYLTHLMLSLAIDQIEDLVREPYAYAQEAELLAPDVPDRVDSFVLSCIARSSRDIRSAAGDLTKKFTTQRRRQLVAV